MEEWRPVKWFENKYLVSNTGRVKSVDRDVVDSIGRVHHFRGKELFQTTVNSGYKQVILYKDSSNYHRYVHQLVATAFVDNPRKLNEVNHKDYDKENNNSDNLEWCTHLENIIDLKIKSKGEYKDSHGKIKLNRCLECGKEIYYTSTRCRDCASKHIKPVYKNGKPIPKEQVISSLTNSKGNFTKASKEFNMSDNSLRKWCKKYELPTHSKDWK